MTIHGRPIAFTCAEAYARRHIDPARFIYGGEQYDRTYKGHTITLRDGWTYLLDGCETPRGNRPRPTRRAAWKAAKAEVNHKRQGIPPWITA